MIIGKTIIANGTAARSVTKLFFASDTMSDKPQHTRKETAPTLEGCVQPSGATAQSETPDFCVLLKQILTKLKIMDTWLGSLETEQGKSVEASTLPTGESPEQGGLPPEAYLCQALEGPTIEKKDEDRLCLAQEEAY